MSVIEEVTYQDIHLLAMNRKVEMKNIAKDIGEMLMGTGKYVKENNIETAGMPISVYSKWDKTSVVMDVGHPTIKKHEGDGEVKYTMLPGSKALKMTHHGDYAQLSVSHAKISKYMQENNIEAAGASWEQCVTDPGLEPDKSKWRTDIFHPIK